MAPPMLLSATLARRGALRRGWVEIERERIAAVGDGEPPRPPDRRLDGILAAGLFDLQVNGAAGHDLAEGGDALERIDAAQLAAGVTAYLGTLPSPDEATARRVLPELAERAGDPGSPLAGVHLEGPFLSPHRAGMHPVARLRAPAHGVPDWMLRPPVRLVTLAPELPGAIELIRRLVDAGIAVSLGHSEADSATAAAAFDAGASLVTHAFNAMGPLGHREPGLVGAALADRRVRVSVIADGEHVDPLVLELIRRACGERAVLVSDAAPPAAAAPGRHRMAGVAIEREPGRAPRTGDGRLADSAITLDEAVRRWTGLTEASLAEALRAATDAPRAVVGEAEGLRPGAPADLVELDERGAVRRSVHRGRTLDGC